VSREGFTIYVDGSCLGNQNVDENTPAGWGMVVVTGDSGLGKGSGKISHEENGRVITDSESSEFIGAEIGSNNTAELTAFAMALRWVLVNLEGEEVLIRSDSTYAGNLADGSWKAKVNKELVATLRRLWEEVYSAFDLSWQHVRAHRGHRWNERADHLASRAATDETPLPLEFWKPGQK
jgi:ribonuclease HI|tara:strand:+ start:856 stop:1392 length:537 start_codon:yes stop_codon:yes gene_type:complete